jgi:hypothetical protein
VIKTGNVAVSKQLVEFVLFDLWIAHFSGFPLGYCCSAWL